MTRRCDFNPRAPCGARHPKMNAVSLRVIFQSTRPVRGATAAGGAADGGAEISIHAPRAGRDGYFVQKNHHHKHFNPRAPCGARLKASSFPSITAVFQSTRPVRGATYPGYPHGLDNGEFQSTRPVRGATIHIMGNIGQIGISIHAPRAGRDVDPDPYNMAEIAISIHAPRAGRDLRSVTQ